MQTNTTRADLVNLIEQRKKEIAKAGPLHKRDLTKNLHRLERQLKEYDRNRKEAGFNE